VPDIIQLLRARVARHSTAPHDDGARIALVVEGGAMRGVISAGMVWALEDLGFVNAFDAVYGSSAGAINAAYFLAGQAGLGTRIYYEDINRSEFINLGRPLRGRPIVDLGFLLEEVALARKPLDADRVLGARSPLTVLATDVETEQAAALGLFSNRRDLLDGLRAGATMPIVAGSPFAYRGRRYLDASLSEPIPVPSAEKDGHTHILVLLTRSGHMRPRPSAFDRYFVGPRLKHLSPGLATRYLTRADPYRVLLQQIDAGHGPSRQAEVLGIRAHGLHVARLERRDETLRAGAALGYSAVTAVFGNGASSGPHT
jgi:predicted patatin/cPLA2 family phospholipase